MFDFISVVVVAICVYAIAWCYMQAMKRGLEKEQNKINEAAAHRLVMKLAEAHSMSDVHQGLDKAKKLRQLRGDILDYAAAIKDASGNEAVRSGEKIVNLLYNKR